MVTGLGYPRPAESFHIKNFAFLHTVAEQRKVAITFSSPLSEFPRTLTPQNIRKSCPPNMDVTQRAKL